MEKIDSILGEGPLSCIKDPFSLENITDITISFYILFRKPVFNGSVSFRKDNTRATQDFKGKDLWDVFVQIATFCKELENK